MADHPIVTDLAAALVDIAAQDWLLHLTFLLIFSSGFLAGVLICVWPSLVFRRPEDDR